MSVHVHGSCSLCGGAVTTPAVWWGANPPTPSCSQCNAVPANAHGPVVEMQPVGQTVRRRIRIATKWGTYALLLLPLLSGCASLQSFTDKAADYQREVEATLMAAQAVAEECRGMDEPKPELCVQVEKLLALVEPEAVE